MHSATKIFTRNLFRPIRRERGGKEQAQVPQGYAAEFESLLGGDRQIGGVLFAKRKLAVPIRLPFSYSIAGRLFRYAIIAASGEWFPTGIQGARVEAFGHVPCILGI